MYIVTDLIFLLSSLIKSPSFNIPAVAVSVLSGTGRDLGRGVETSSLGHGDRCCLDYIHTDIMYSRYSRYSRYVGRGEASKFLGATCHPVSPICLQMVQMDFLRLLGWAGLGWAGRDRGPDFLLSNQKLMDHNRSASKRREKVLKLFIGMASQLNVSVIKCIKSLIVL